MNRYDVRQGERKKSWWRWLCDNSTERFWIIVHFAKNDLRGVRNQHHDMRHIWSVVLFHIQVVILRVLYEELLWLYESRVEKMALLAWGKRRLYLLQTIWKTREHHFHIPLNTFSFFLCSFLCTTQSYLNYWKKHYSIVVTSSNNDIAAFDQIR